MGEKISRGKFIKGLGIVVLNTPVLFDSYAPSQNKKNKYSNKEFKHPGILAGQRTLSHLKSAINQNRKNPAKEGCQKMLSSKYAKLKYQPKSFEDVAVTASGGNPEESHYRGDAHAAYADALIWVITGNPEYRNKCIKILNLWANTVKTFHVTNRKTDSQITLETSWAIPEWVSAAEIIRYYSGGLAEWPPADIDNFNSFLRLQLNYVNGPIASAPNWHASRALARMSAGVFMNDRELYKQGYSEAKHQISLIGTEESTLKR
jgi:hypothetical protein